MFSLLFSFSLSFLLPLCLYPVSIFFAYAVMMDEPRFAQPIPNVTVAVGRDANLPCVVEHLGAYKVCINIAVCCTFATLQPFAPIYSYESIIEQQAEQNRTKKNLQLLMNKNGNNAIKKPARSLSLSLSECWAIFILDHFIENGRTACNGLCLPV